MSTTPPARRRRRRASAEDARLEAEARKLHDAGDRTGALSLLEAGGALFARHEPTALPCLCEQCLQPDLSEAESQGVAYVRDFVVTERRVLFYWMPAELAGNAKQVRASMRAELRARGAALRLWQTEPRKGVNPFTKESISIPGELRRTRINPFTGKPVP